MTAEIEANDQPSTNGSVPQSLEAFESCDAIVAPFFQPVRLRTRMDGQESGPTVIGVLLRQSLFHLIHCDQSIRRHHQTHYV